MTVTISTHNGSAVAVAHNLRLRNVTDKEEHIDPNGVHETWAHEDVKGAYERLFGDAVRKYNEKQKRPDNGLLSAYKEKQKQTSSL
jgi:hypothetical protein